MIKKKFRIGGIEECFLLASILSLFYLLFNAIIGFRLPLFDSEISKVFATFVILVPLNFMMLSLLEIFWFERDLNWDGEVKLLEIKE